MFPTQNGRGTTLKTELPKVGHMSVYERSTKLASSIMEKDKSEHARPPPPPSFNSCYNQKGLCDHSKRKPNKIEIPSDLFYPSTSSTPILKTETLICVFWKSLITWDNSQSDPTATIVKSAHNRATYNYTSIKLHSQLMIIHVTTKMPPSPTYSCKPL